MRRTQDNGIHFGKGEQLRLICERAQIADQGIFETYLVEGNSQSVQFTPGELAELRCAIHEMLRMAEQHRDALTDGAGVQVAEADEGKGMIEMLSRLVDGHEMFRHHALFGLLQANGLIEKAPRAFDHFTISVKGRALLEAQAPSANALTAGVAAQTPEVESELDVLDFAILHDLAEPGESLIRFWGDSGFTWGLSGEDSSFTRNDLSRLYEQKLIHFSSTEKQVEDLKASYHITDEGRRVLAEQEG